MDTSRLLQMPSEILDTNGELIELSFHLDSSMMLDTEYTCIFLFSVVKVVLQLDKEDRVNHKAFAWFQTGDSIICQQCEHCWIMLRSKQIM